MVARHQWHFFRYGMGNNQVVARVIMPLRFIDLQSGIRTDMLLLNG